MMTPMAASLITPVASSLIQPVASSLINSVTGKGQEVGILPLLALSLLMTVLGKEVRRSGTECDIWTKNFSSAPSFKQYWDY